jgi:hypothetical protein
MMDDLKFEPLPAAVLNCDWPDAFCARVLFFEVHGDVVVARMFYSIRNKKERVQRIQPDQIEEGRRIVFRSDYIQKFDNYGSAWRNMGVPREGNISYKLSQSKDELKRLFSTTFLARSPWFEYPDLNVQALYKFTRWPALEYLWKRGYKELTKEIIYGRTREDRTINLYKTKCNEILGVPHSVLQKYGHETLRECDIKAIKQLIEFGRLGQLTPERFNFIKSILTSHSLDPLDIFRTFGIEKVLNYIDRQAAGRGSTCRDTYTWRDFQDYRKECHELGYDLTDEGVMFPRDLYAAHERTSQLCRAEAKRRMAAARRAEQEQAREREKAVAEKYVAAIKKYLEKNFGNGRYVMRVAGSPAELADEGKALHHCVGGYAARVANKHCLIFFVRSAAAPDKPLYTLEINYQTHGIIQCRGFGNSQAPAEVFAFIQDVFKQKEVV